MARGRGAGVLESVAAAELSSGSGSSRDNQGQMRQPGCVGVGTGQRGGRWGRRDRESLVGTVVSPGASLRPGHINIDPSRGSSSEGQKKHQASATVQASGPVLRKPTLPGARASCKHSLGSLIMILPMPASSAPTGRPSLTPRHPVTHPLPDHPLAPAYFPLRNFYCLLPIPGAKTTQTLPSIWRWGSGLGRHGMRAGGGGMKGTSSVRVERKGQGQHRRLNPGGKSEEGKRGLTSWGPRAMGRMLCEVRSKWPAQDGSKSEGQRTPLREPENRVPYVACIAPEGGGWTSKSRSRGGGGMSWEGEGKAS